MLDQNVTQSCANHAPNCYSLGAQCLGMGRPLFFSWRKMDSKGPTTLQLQQIFRDWYKSNIGRSPNSQMIAIASLFGAHLLKKVQETNND